MAYYEQKSKNSYKIVVSMGYDSNGKHRRVSKTVKLPENMSESKRQKELNTLCVLFQQEVENGLYLDGGKITFGEFAAKWLTDYAEKNLAPTTLVSYKIILNRILPALGHITLSKLQPHHLIQFYNNLDEEGARLDGRFTPTKALTKYLEPLTISHIIKTTGISSKTCRRLKTGMATNYSTAQKLCNYYKLDFNRMFNGNSEKKLTRKTIKNHHIVIH